MESIRKKLKENCDWPDFPRDSYTYIGEMGSDEFYDIVGVLEDAGALIDRSISERGIVVEKDTDLSQYLTDEMISKLEKSED